MRTKKIKELEKCLIDDKAIIDLGFDNEDSEDFSYGSNDYEKYLGIGIGNNSTIGFSLKDSAVSCGTREIYDLPNNYRFTEILHDVKPEYRNKFVQELFKEYFKQLKNMCNCCFLTFSNNDASTNSMINEILDKLAVSKTRWKINPNSGNKIKIWIL